MLLTTLTSRLGLLNICILLCFFPVSFFLQNRNKCDYNQTYRHLCVTTKNCSDKNIQADTYIPVVNDDNSLKNRSIFVDLGGYTGDTLKLYGTGQDEIYVFEIDTGKVDSILHMLKTNLKHLRNNTQIFNNAAWNEDAVIQVTLTGGNDGHVTSTGGTPILAYDLGAWLKRVVKPRSSDMILLKMDIEGAEIQVLQSLDEADVLQFIDHFIIEWHDWLIPQVAAAKPTLEALLKKNTLVYEYATLDDKLDKKILPGEPWPVHWCDSHYFRK